MFLYGKKSVYARHCRYFSRRIMPIVYHKITFLSIFFLDIVMRKTGMSWAFIPDQNNAKNLFVIANRSEAIQRTTE